MVAGLSKLDQKVCQSAIFKGLFWFLKNVVLTEALKKLYHGCFLPGFLLWKNVKLKKNKDKIAKIWISFTCTWNYWRSKKQKSYRKGRLFQCKRIHIGSFMCKKNLFQLKVYRQPVPKSLHSIKELELKHTCFKYENL